MLINHCRLIQLQKKRSLWPQKIEPRIAVAYRDHALSQAEPGQPQFSKHGVADILLLISSIYSYL